MTLAKARDAALATRFTQFGPEEGRSATQRTEAHVLYGGTTHFVFMPAHDTSPSEIARQLTLKLPPLELEWAVGTVCLAVRCRDFTLRRSGLVIDRNLFLRT